MIPNTYPLKHQLNKGVDTLFIFLITLFYLSKSYFKHKVINIPGITISPNPNKEYFISLFSY